MTTTQRPARTRQLKHTPINMDGGEDLKKNHVLLTLEDNGICWYGTLSIKNLFMREGDMVLSAKGLRRLAAVAEMMADVIESETKSPYAETKAEIFGQKREAA